MDLNAQCIYDPRLGIVLYKNALPNSISIINRLEKTLEQSNNPRFKWSLATTGDENVDTSYRNCSDFKIHPDNTKWEMFPEMQEIKHVVFEVKDAIINALYDYEIRYPAANKMDFMESFNFVKYGPGEYFKPHTDHGFSYNATVSCVLYLNDDYDGGELAFNSLGFKIKPKAGDLIFFPSNYIFVHSSEPVNLGIKYSVVTMFDYNERTHKNFQYGHNLDGSPADPNAGRGPRFADKIVQPLKQLDTDYKLLGV